METVGIIAEYNPFHNGHLYHLNKVKQMFPDHLIVLVLTGNYTQRGTFSIIEKYDKAKIALDYGIDLIVELPYNFVVQSADEFAKGSIQILNELKIKKIVFGSESNDILKLKEIAKLYLTESNNSVIKEQIKNGATYPSAISKLLPSYSSSIINNSNDILGICYIKEIIKNNYDIIPYSIKRTNNYNDLDSNDSVISSSNIREKLKNKISIKKYIPKNVLQYINNDFNYDFSILKYNIINNIDNLDKFLLVDTPLANLIKKNIFLVNTQEELISKIKTKNYTYGKISRVLCNIVCNYKKDDKYEKIKYLNILGSSKKGLKYLNNIKKNISNSIVCKYSDFPEETKNLENRLDYIYNMKKNNKKTLKETKIIVK